MQRARAHRLAQYLSAPLGADHDQRLSGVPFCDWSIPGVSNRKIRMLAEVIAIGDELTSGQRLDTNSQWLSRELGLLGVVVSGHTTVPDTIDDAVRAFREARQRANVVVATGGLSIPKIGASKFGYDIAKQFGLNVISTSPALVPLTFNEDILKICKELTGLSVDAVVSFGKTLFQEGMLFTHRGLSGPSILQISSYWKLKHEIQVNLSPDIDVYEFDILKTENYQNFIKNLTVIFYKFSITFKIFHKYLYNFITLISTKNINFIFLIIIFHHFLTA